MNQFKTYIIKPKKAPDVWLFKYHLEGELHSFEVTEGTFNKQQADWLFNEGRFPYSEEIIKKWIESKTLKKYFDIEINLPEITFEFFYDSYKKKTTKKQALDFWNKRMTDAEKVNAVLGIRKYFNYLKLYPYREKVDPIRFLRNRRYEDEF